METGGTTPVAKDKEKFKSYYVVWKPTNKIRFDVNKIGFKSYYVVWKRSKFNLEHIVFLSLNRTMQYGNTVEAFTP